MKWLKKIKVLRPIETILQYAPSPLKRMAGLLCILGFVMAVIEFVVAGSVSLLGLALASPQGVANLEIFQIFFEIFPFLADHASNSIFLLAYILSFVCVCLLVKNVCMAFFTLKSTENAYNLAGSLAEKIFSSFLCKPFLWHLQQNPSDLSLYIQWRQHTANYLIQLLSLVSQGVTVLCLLIGSLYLNTLGTSVVFGITGITAVFVYVLSRKRLDKASVEAKDMDTHINKLTLSCLQGIREVYIYGKRKDFKQQFSSLWPKQAHAQAIRAVCLPMPSWVLEVAGIVTLLIALFSMYSFGESTNSIVAGIALLAAVSWRILPAANRSLSAVLGMRSSLPMLEQILPLLVSVEELKKDHCATSICFNNKISLDNVYFNYPDSTKMALENVSIQIDKGQMIGIIGASGAGKSTLVDILTGLVVCTKGQVSVDGVALTEDTYGAWQANIAYVAQNPYLTEASLAENIALRFWGNDFDREKVHACSEMAAVDFIDELSHGIDTQVGERGVRLSGGQVQRIAIARALYVEPSFLVFDEATSALDSNNETLIQNAINSLKGKQTIAIIAHRLSSVKECDRVFWLEKGKLKMVGTPEEVLPLYEKCI